MTIIGLLKHGCKAIGCQLSGSFLVVKRCKQYVKRLYRLIAGKRKSPEIV